MSNSRVDEFENRLRESGLLKDEQITRALSAGKGDPRYAAKHLVNLGQLTEWQAKSLLAGRSQLKIGSYVLLESLEKNEIGRRFLAIHASLSRKVVLQFLPSDFDAKSDNFRAFIRTANQLSQIDHSNLAHVYDVSAEKGNYFVIQEFVDGMPICEMDLQSLSQDQAIGFIDEMASAVKFLHDMKIEHGTITEKNIWVNSHGQIQILDLIANELRKSVLKENDSELAQSREFGMIDRVGIQGVCGDIMESVFGRNGDTQILGAIVQMPRSAQALDRLVEKTAQWRLEREGGSKVNDYTMEPVESDINPTGFSETQSEPGAAIRPALPARSVGTPNEKSTKLKSKSSDDRRDRRTLIVGGIVFSAVLLTLAGFSTWYLLNAKKAGTELANKENAKTQSTKRIMFEDLPNDSSTVPKTPNASSLKNMEGESKKNTEGESKTIEIQDETKKTVESESQIVEPQATVVLPAVSEPVVQTNDSPAIKSIAQEKEKKDPFKMPLTAGSTVETKNETIAAETNSGGNNSPIRVTPQENAPAASIVSIADLPVAIDLKSSETTSPQTIGKIGIGSLDKLTVELKYSSKYVGKGTNFFELRIANSAPEVWELFYSKRDEEAEFAKVGSFSIVDGALQYAWDAELDDNGNHNYLVNTALFVAQGAEAKTIALRKPVVLDDLKINEKTFSEKGYLGLEWMPASDTVRFEPGELNAEKWPKGSWVNPEQANRQPAAIVFGEPTSEQFCWISIATEIKSRVDFRIDVQARNGNEVFTMKPRTLSEAVAALNLHYEQMVVKSDQAQQAAANAPYGMKTKTKDAAREIRMETESLQAFRLIALEQAGTVEGMVNEPIPYRVVFQFDGQLIELARSSTFSTPLPSLPE